MKKYISTVTLQTGGAQKHYYRDEQGLDTPRVYTAFPILQQISDTAVAGEEIQIVTVVVGGVENNKNYAAFTQELDALAKERGLSYTHTTIDKEDSEEVNTIISLFSAIIAQVADGDRLYACVTYGTKPIATVTTMALHYAYRIKTGVVVEAVKYGLKDWNATEEPACVLYDTTALFYIDCLIDRIAAMKLENPESALKALIQGEKGK